MQHNRGEVDCSMWARQILLRKRVAGEMITLLIISEKERKRKRDIAVGCKDNTYLIYVISFIQLNLIVITSAIKRVLPASMCRMQSDPLGTKRPRVIKWVLNRPRWKKETCRILLSTLVRRTLRTRLPKFTVHFTFSSHVRKFLQISPSLCARIITTFTYKLEKGFRE